jgi:hypothetical protein
LSQHCQRYSQVKHHVVRKKQFDECNSQEEILEAERAFKVKYFLLWLYGDHLKTRFEELMVFKCLFGFLLSSNNLKSLNDSELEKCCQKIANILSHDGSSDAEVHDFISELKIFKCTIPNGAISAMEIFEHIRDLDCYLMPPLLIASYLSCLLLLDLLK